ncbi:MAG: hypothetical protein FWF67_03710 [Fibromonadales bacterium]|nr:hypothetical protein [Fibromonadales bacterium]
MILNLTTLAHRYGVTTDEMREKLHKANIPKGYDVEVVDAFMGRKSVNEPSKSKAKIKDMQENIAAIVKTNNMLIKQNSALKRKIKEQDSFIEFLIMEGESKKGKRRSWRELGRVLGR